LKEPEKAKRNEEGEKDGSLFFHQTSMHLQLMNYLLAVMTRGTGPNKFKSSTQF
jgi:hypothetical protein